MYRTSRSILQAIVCMLAMYFASVAATATSNTTNHDHNVLSSRQGQGQRQTKTNNRLVFCHFMMGIVGLRTSPADYDADMLLAKETGIDAFALNIGTDPFTDTQLRYAYSSAAANNMSVFISFDFNWWDAQTQAKGVGNKVAQFAYEPAQLWVDGKVFASSFSGDGLDVWGMRQTVWDAAGVEVFWAPNYRANNLKGEGLAGVDGALNWMAWPNNGDNKAPTADANFTVEDGDKEYMNALAGKPYIAPVSPWFSTHYGPEVPYSKNFVFPSDLLWYNRWISLLKLNPRFIEIISWNDYGESHYVGPLSSPHNDDGNSKWTNDMPHTPMLHLSAPFIQAYKSPNNNSTSTPKINDHIKSDQLFYWYRPTPKSLNCTSTDTTTNPSPTSHETTNSTGNYFPGPPNGADSPTLTDSIFLVSLLTKPALITVTSGSNNPLNQSTRTFEAGTGASSFEVPMRIGRQEFRVERHGGEVVMGGVSVKDVVGECVCGIYNFNFFAGMFSLLGSASASASLVSNSGAGEGEGEGGVEVEEDRLGPQGLAMFEEGLRVGGCSAVPSLGMTAMTAVTTTSSSSSSSVVL